MFRCQAVVDAEDRTACLIGKRSADPLVGVKIPDNPPTSMEIDQRRKNRAVIGAVFPVGNRRHAFGKLPGRNKSIPAKCNLPGMGKISDPGSQVCTGLPGSAIFECRQAQLGKFTKELFNLWIQRHASDLLSLERIQEL